MSDLYITAVVARVCGLDWETAQHVSVAPQNFPNPRLVAGRFAREVVNPRDAGARWCSAAMLQRLSPMIGRQTHVIVIDVRDGELMETLTREAKERGITNAAIVSLIGGVDRFTISTMPEDDATADVITDYVVPAEMHGGGEFMDGVPHVHATMAVAGDRGLAGHLHAAHIGTWFARAYVLPF
ncbi:MAG: DUF296 domain-containing protein [Umezawaea sp.]